MFGIFKKHSPVVLGGRGRSGTVAISYLREPFLRLSEEAARGHTNWQECRMMAEEWVARGYRVEVIDYRDSEYLPPPATRFAIDIHGNLERWVPQLPKVCTKVLHATGAHWLTQNAAELSRLEAIKCRRGRVLRPRRSAQPSRAIEFADYTTVLGNRFTIDSFAFSGKPCHRIPISCAVTPTFPVDRNWEVARNRFLWIGSFGMVHKGLDLVLEAFSKMPDCHLTVCGRPEKEEDFSEEYDRELRGLPNVFLAGWMDMNTPQFGALCRTHGGIIYPSCSEGGGGVVIHAMARGLIPITTPGASIDLADYGMAVEDASPQGVADAIGRLRALSNAELESRARAGWDVVREQHSPGAFRENYRNFVGRISAG